MNNKDFYKLKSLRECPELFEKQRQHLIQNLISSIANKEEQTRLRSLQKELDLNRDHSNFQTTLAEKLLERVTQEHRLLKTIITNSLDRHQPSNIISFPENR